MSRSNAVGFVGASSMERLPVEQALSTTTEHFKSIPIGSCIRESAMTIALIAALDTKAADAAFLAARLRSRGHDVTIVDIGVLGDPGIDARHRRVGSVAAAGGCRARTSSSIARRPLRRVAVMAAGATACSPICTRRGRLTGALAIGGGAGTTIGAAALRALPLGLPKVVLSTIAAADSGRFVGTSDIVMFPSIVDIAGINRISAITYAPRGRRPRRHGRRARRPSASGSGDPRRRRSWRRPCSASPRRASCARSSSLEDGRLRGPDLPRHRRRRPHDGTARRRRARSTPCST